MTRKTITATIYETQKTVRLSISHDLYLATARAEMATGVKLCGYHRGRKWGIVHALNIWTRPDGTTYGDEYTAYLLGNETDRTAFDALCSEYNSSLYRY